MTARDDTGPRPRSCMCQEQSAVAVEKNGKIRTRVDAFIPGTSMMNRC